MYSLSQAMSPNWNHYRYIRLGTIRYCTSGHECQPAWFPPSASKGTVRRSSRQRLHHGDGTTTYTSSSPCCRAWFKWNKQGYLALVELWSNKLHIETHICCTRTASRLFWEFVWLTTLETEWSLGVYFKYGRVWMNLKLICFFAGHGGMVPSCKSHKKRTGAHRPYPSIMGHVHLLNNTTHPVQ